MREILIGPVAGVILAAVLQYFFAKTKERESQFSVLRHEAYADYLKAVAALATNSSTETIGKVIDAKARIAVYGSDAVIEKLADLETTSLKLADESTQAVYTSLVEEMRREGGWQRGTLRPETLTMVLFGRHSPRAFRQQSAS